MAIRGKGQKLKDIGLVGTESTGDVATFDGTEFTAQTPVPDKNFKQDFVNTTSVVVNHSLGKRPAITVIDSANTEIVADIEHNTNNTCTVSWNGGIFSGTVFCN